MLHDKATWKKTSCFSNQENQVFMARSSRLLLGFRILAARERRRVCAHFHASRHYSAANVLVYDYISHSNLHKRPIKSIKDIKWSSSRSRSSSSLTTASVCIVVVITFLFLLFNFWFFLSLTRSRCSKQVGASTFLYMSSLTRLRNSARAPNTDSITTMIRRYSFPTPTYIRHIEGDVAIEA